MYELACDTKEGIGHKKGNKYVGLKQVIDTLRSFRRDNFEAR